MNFLNRTEEEKTGGSQRKNTRRLILLILFLLFFLSSYLVFFMTGKNGDRPVKLPSDTIVLTPEGGESGTAFHLGGRILYEDGTPFAGGTVELQSEVRTTVADEEGRFLFDHVESGEHTLKAVDGNGEVLAECRFLLTKSEMEEPLFFIEKGNGEYELQTNINLRFLEITAQIRTEDRVLVLQPDMSTLNHMGILTTKGGVHDTRTGLATVTPVGLVILPSGYIILPGKEYIQPDDTMVEITEEADILPDGTCLYSDGRTVLPGGTVILPDGTIRLPSGREHPPLPSGSYLDKDLGVYPIGGGPEAGGNESVGEQPQEDQETTEAAGPEPDEEGKTPGTGDGKTPGNGDGRIPGTGAQGDTGGDGETPAPVSDAVIQGFEGYTNWKTLTHINLFGQREDETKPVEIRPGSRGSYTFKLKNGNSYPLIASVTMSDEHNEHRLDFLYRLKETRSGTWLAGDDNTWLTPETFSTKPFVIKPKLLMEYTLEWYWPYERASASIAGEATPVNSDKLDTEAGIEAGNYDLELTVNAELIQ